MKHKLLGVLGLLFLLSINAAFAVSPVSDLKKVGSGQMEWLFFSLYDASLYSETGTYQSNRFPIALQIKYHKQIDKKHLLEATQEQWQHLGIDNKQQNDWLMLLNQIWPDVNSGDELTFVVQADASNMFYFNNEPIGKIEDGAFSAAFLAIWLSENTSRPKLRQQLIGAL
ncbi:chalcone isomerase family protein [Motilimonas cestriensis]|uniref:Chalcone isomerase family protein n=1 Tax=Motilimonas cestriensis TaxID=2742685 RepID=A0ABS8WFJ1_9GAMM|nr:chalcone isomerase family protein [Motilimonas cestriensis]MCE2597068.1 chalcone isomerase family protein [Motilimonas cestriensis]